ncbi:MAG: hypothetical protein JSS82_09890 [Bacteroidetes bacterium]|nr:hypothetical protein [Bacteroidota bacterium]
MATKNLYYRTMYGRTNALKTFVFGVLASVSSYPRLVMEVFIRKNMGERYFNLMSAITVAVLLAVIPVIPNPFSYFSYSRYSEYAGSPDGSSFSWAHYFTWYAFLAAFLYFSYLRYKEVKRNPSVFDFAKFSLYSGDINPAFFKVQIPGVNTTVRNVQTLIEPAAFFLAGLVLWMVSQKLGMLFMVCAVIYSASYIYSYMQGDNFVMDKIDEIILNGEMKESFVEGMDDGKNGVRLTAKIPDTPELRRQILPLMMEETEEKEKEIIFAN